MKNNRSFLKFIPLLIIASVASIIARTNLVKSDISTGQVAPPSSDKWIVIKVSDGDTITVRQTNGQEIKVRLGCIDAPETSKGTQVGQVFGEESKKNLEKLIESADNQVMVTILDSDKYGRKVAEVYTTIAGKEKFLNEEQLTSGFAYLYHRYLKNCPNAESLKSAEAIAQQKRIGVWSQNLERPWDFRKRIKQRK